MVFLKRWLLASIVMMLVTLGLHAATAINIDTEESTNGDCPGEMIALLDSTNTHYDTIGTGRMNTSWDIDRYYFKPQHAGTVKVSLVAPHVMTIKGGDVCNTQSFFRSDNAMNHSAEFHVNANQTVNLSMFEWSTGAGFDYDLSIEFIPDNPDTSTPDPEPTPDPTPDPTPTPSNGTMTIDTTSNNDCPSEVISVLDGVVSSTNLTGQGTMDGVATWDVDRYTFTPNASGTVTLTLNSPQATTFKAGTSCNTENYFRSNSQTAHTQSFHVNSGQAIHMTAFDWDSNGYSYDLNVVFVPDNEPSNPTPNPTPTPGVTGELSGQNFTDASSGAMTHSALANQIVGTTKGEFSVNQGAANYSVKIDVPPGRGGMEPKLSLDYNSNGGDGYLGKGWGIGGLDVISRCPSTKLVDGKIRGVKLDANDQYCLNGQRLIKISDYPTEGDAEYRTEVDSFAKVIAFHDSLSPHGPDYWKVWTKSGLVYEYGNTHESRITADQVEISGKQNRALRPSEVATSWAVNKISDRTTDGNSIDFYYDNSGLERHIRKIIYTGGEVLFHFEPRAYQVKGFYAGSTFQVGERLERIEVEDNDQNELRSYVIEYKDNTDLIASIQEKAGDAGLYPLEKLAFTWTDVSDVVYNEASKLPDIETLINRNYKHDDRIYGANDHDNWSYNYYPDFDGDGLTDICYRSDKGIKCYRNQGGGSFLTTPTISTSICANGSATSDGVCNDSDNWDTIQFMDITGDGKSDLIYRSDNGMRIYKSTGTAFTSFQNTTILSNSNDGSNYKYIHYTDINNDSYVDLCYRSTSGIKCHLNQNGAGYNTSNVITTSICKSRDTLYGTCNSEDNYKTIRFTDVNGDSQPDIFYRSDEGIRVWENMGNGTFKKYYQSDILRNGTSSYGDHSSADNYYSIKLPDINGDGLQDLCYRTDNGGVTCHLNNGKSYEHSRIVTNVCDNGEREFGICNDADNFNTIRYLDVNHDGKSDLLYRSDGGMRIWTSTGDRFEWYSAHTMLENGRDIHDGGNLDQDNYGTLQYVDMTGDGAVDLVYRSDKKGIVIYKNRRHQPKIKQIDNGEDQNIKIYYAGLVNNSLYTKGTTYGTNVALTPLMSVVSHVDSLNGLGMGTNRISYLYHDYRMHRKYGNLGFRQILQRDHSSGVYTTTTYKQVFPYIGRVDYVKSGRYRSYLDSNPSTSTPDISYVKHYWATRVHADHRKVYQPYLERKETYDYLTRITLEDQTVMRNDSFGNVEKVISKKMPQGSGTTYTTTTTNYYNDEDETKWIIGRLSKSTVDYSSSDASELAVPQKESTFTYYTQNSNDGAVLGMLASETIKGTPTKSYKYDRYGNKIEERVSGAGLTTDLITTYEYNGANNHNHRFVTKTINSKGHYSTKTYNIAFGTVASASDQYNNSVHYLYDVMGKKIEARDSYGNKTYWRHTWDRSVTYSLYAVTSYGTNTPLSKIYYDKLGRELQSYTTTMNNQQIVKSKIYNSKGELDYELLPGGQKVDYSYDTYGRETSVKRLHPNGSGDVYDRIAYNGLITIQTDSVGVQKKITKNAMGKVIEVVDGANASNANEKSTITYKYYKDGKLHKTIDSANNQIVMEYNNPFGLKSKMIDPDMGTWSYYYTPLGKLKEIHDPKEGHVTKMEYDSLGRMTHKYARDFEYQWIYDTRKAGLISQEIKTDASSGAILYKKDYHYNARLALEQSIEAFDNVSYTTQMNYYSNGKLKDLTYPNGLTVRHNYKNGYLHRIQDGTNTDGKFVYAITETDHLGHVKKAVLENGITNSMTYNNAGLITSVNGSGKTHLSYSYDKRGNVKTKTDHLIGYHNGAITGLTESYTYDKLNRLQDVQVDCDALSNAEKLRYYHYDNLGNLTNKNGITQTYGSARPHAITSTSDGRNFSYDANGNMIKDGSKTIKYNRANKPIEISQNGTILAAFAYNTNGNRYKKVFANNSSTTHYIGKLYEKSSPHSSDNYKEKNFIYFGDKLIKIKERDYAGAYEPIIVKESYIHTDNLGSVIAITDKAGAITSRRSHMPFGELRHLLYKEGVERANNMSSQALLQASIETTNRGFTGHEHIEGTDYIHMNGRVYDPTIGRFLSADPHIQAPNDTQSYNRYSYVKNNPLNYTDPSGYFFKKFFKKHLRTIIAIAVAALITWATAGGGVAAWSSFFSGFGGKVAAGALAGAASGGIATGTLKGALQGAVFGAISGGVAYGIGEQFAAGGGLFDKGSFNLSKHLTHGLSRAAIGKAQGGTWSGGFWSGLASSALSPGTTMGGSGAGGFTLRTTIAGVVGGTASELGGGKFANGAVSGAFTHMFNHEFHKLVDAYQGRDDLLKEKQFSKWAHSAIIDSNGGSCAVRLCNAFNRAGYDNILDGAPSQRVISDTDGNKYMLGAAELAKQLDVSNSAYRVTDISMIAGKQGIIYFENYHIDLWDKTEMIGNGSLESNYLKKPIYFKAIK